MKRYLLALQLGLAVAIVAPPDALAQGPAPAPSASKAANPNPDVLKGTWVRPDGGYVIGIRGVGPDGQLDATYYNPNQLPFSRAQATNADGTLRVVLVLHAGGYAGSTYELVYDPASDRLRGTFKQVVAKQTFDVYFARR